MTYTLYRVDDPTGDPTTGVNLGLFASFEEALEARDEDTAQLFAATGAGLTLVAHHQIVGPGTLGNHTAHPISTGLPMANCPTEGDVAEARRWLEQIHRGA